MTDVPGFEWTDDMAEISGFGGGYELCCRRMISMGCAWWSEHPDANPRFRGFEGIYGLIDETNADAEALTKAVIDASDGEATGAMHQAAITHIMAWRHRFAGSWRAYQAEMRKPRKDDE